MQMSRVNSTRDQRPTMENYVVPCQLGVFVSLLEGGSHTRIKWISMPLGNPIPSRTRQTILMKSATARRRRV